MRDYVLFLGMATASTLGLLDTPGLSFHNAYAAKYMEAMGQIPVTIVKGNQSSLQTCLTSGQCTAIIAQTTADVAYNSSTHMAVKPLGLRQDPIVIRPKLY